MGGQQKFADRLNMSRQQASHIIGRNPHKGIGHQMARRIEEVFEMPVGWLDIDHTTPALVNEDTIEVPLLSSMASAGTDALPAPSDEAVRRIVLSKRWVRLNVQATAFEHLALLTAMGDSMEPTFYDGSILLVDRGVTNIKVDGVYVITKEDELYVKRVQRDMAGGVTMLSDNTSYKPLKIDKKMQASLLVLGRVLAAWNPKKL